MNIQKKHFKYIWAGFGLILVVMLGVYFFKSSATEPLKFSILVERIRKGQVQELSVQDDEVRVVYKDGGKDVSYFPRVLQFQNFPFDLLRKQGVKYQFVPADTSYFGILTLIQILLPFICIFGIWFFIFRQSRGGNRALGFGQSKAQVADPSVNRVTFADVEGAEEAKESLREIVDFLKYPEKFEAVGGRIPRGVLLVGLPGTGKTLLARAVAGEAGVPFLAISGSDFVEMFVGVGASRVRDLFRQAKECHPCIIFIDELDSVGRSRSSGWIGGGSEEREQTLNQLLVEMDGFDVKTEVIVMAATNRMDVLDPALLRPGRFDRQVEVPLPDINGREKILKVHARNVKIGEDVSFLGIARGTPGFSGADLANLINEAALRAARYGKAAVEMIDLEMSRDRIIMGAERQSFVLSEEDRRLVAYHEAGHALVAYHSRHSDPIHKATIMPRSGALGMVVRLPETDKVSMKRATLMSDLDVAFGGRVAEEMMFGTDSVTTGAENDIRVATQIARKMVLSWGMSEGIGLISYNDMDANRPLGLNLSDQEVASIDAEIRKILEAAHARAFKVLSQHKSQLCLLAESLMEHETLSGDEIAILLKSGTLKKVKEKDSEKIDTLGEPKKEEACLSVQVDPFSGVTLDSSPVA